MTSPRRLVRPVVGLLATCALVAACGGSAAKSGEDVIEGELAEQIDLGDLEADCNEPDDLKEGETFTCTATTADGGTLEFLGTMSSDDEFNIVTTNLLVPSDIELIVDAAATALSEEIGVPVAPEDISCPEGSVILDEAGEVDCEITDTATGDVYALTVSTGGLEPGVGAKNLQFQIGEQPL
jgi:hypothetical protein